MKLNFKKLKIIVFVSNNDIKIYEKWDFLFVGEENERKNVLSESLCCWIRCESVVLGKSGKE